MFVRQKPAASRPYEHRTPSMMLTDDLAGRMGVRSIRRTPVRRYDEEAEAGAVEGTAGALASRIPRIQPVRAAIPDGGR